MQKEMNIDSLAPAVVYEQIVTRTHHSDSIASNVSIDSFIDSGNLDPEVAQAMLQFTPSDSPGTSLRKRLA